MIEPDLNLSAIWVSYLFPHPLLDQMVLEINGIRPAVLSTETKEKLEDYRGLRHVVRNVYTFRLNPEKLAILVKNLPDVMSKTELELTGFARFLQGV